MTYTYTHIIVYIKIYDYYTELKSYIAKASKDSKPYIDHIIRLHEERQIASFKTAINTGLHLINPVAVLNGRAEHEYNNVVAKYEHATPSTGKNGRDIEKKNDEGDRVKVQQPDYSKPR